MDYFFFGLGGGGVGCAFTRLQLCSMSKVCESFNEMLSSGMESEGVILLGDSSGAHFHIPPEWMTPTQMSLVRHGSLLLYRCQEGVQEFFTFFILVLNENRCGNVTFSWESSPLLRKPPL